MRKTNHTKAQRGFTQAIVAIFVLAGCPTGDARNGNVTNHPPAGDAAALDCAPIGLPGLARQCPAGCGTIEGVALSWDDAARCLNPRDSNGYRPGEAIIVGCFPPGTYTRSSAVTCYTVEDGSLFIRTAEIFEELLDQGWQLCSDAQSLYCSSTARKP